MSPPHDPSSYDTRRIDSAVQTCPPCHWFSITLVHADQGRKRPAWWPKEKLKGYAGEPMQITLAGVGPRQQLDGNGKFRQTKLPGGDASVQFDEFHRAIAAALTSGRKF
jgi:hypothetical protein